jgi:Protein of unknwon function (DUF3310)
MKMGFAKGTNCSSRIRVRVAHTKLTSVRTSSTSGEEIFRSSLVLGRSQRVQMAKESEPDLINHPPHYTHGPIEVIDLIELFDLDYHEGNVLKYLLRHKHKGGVQDLRKAEWYIKRLIKIAEEGPGSTAPGSVKEEFSRARGLSREDPGPDISDEDRTGTTYIRGEDQDWPSSDRILKYPSP